MPDTIIDPNPGWITDYMFVWSLCVSILAAVKSIIYISTWEIIKQG